MQQDTTAAYDLRRFVLAQQSAYATALSELKASRKKTHWIWFVIPQVEGLGASSMSKRYAIKSREAAVAYLAHPLLGTRLVERTKAVLSIEGRSAHLTTSNSDLR